MSEAGGLYGSAVRESLIGWRVVQVHGLGVFRELVSGRCDSIGWSLTLMCARRRQALGDQDAVAPGCWFHQLLL